MKDAYSFHADEESLDKTYRDMYDAYTRIFRRCGLRFGAVEADSGAIGGDVTHEFMVFAESGESQVLACECGYSATIDRAQADIDDFDVEADEKPLQKVSTPSMKTVNEVTQFLDKKPWELLKTILYWSDGKHVAVLIRGDRDINEVKLARVLGSCELRLATPDEIQEVTGAPLGFSGPVGLRGIRIIADHTVAGMKNMVTGANQADAHFINVNVGRDFEVDDYYDLVVVKEGDKCKRCGNRLSAWRGIEVGQIFKLGTKYSKAMKAHFLDEAGKERPFIMGCYGIGITRTVAAAIEQHCDQDGIAWPISIAPFEVHILPTNVTDSRIREVAEGLYRGLLERGVEVLIDDRNERPGTKFKDADLVGIPVRITVGEKGIKENKVEIRKRHSGEVTRVEVTSAIEQIAETVSNLKANYSP